MRVGDFALYSGTYPGAKYRVGMIDRCENHLCIRAIHNPKWVWTRLRKSGDGYYTQMNFRVHHPTQEQIDEALLLALTNDVLEIGK